MSKKGKRGLSSDDRALWDKVKRSANPMHPGSHAQPMPEVFEPKIVEPQPIPAFQVGERATSTALPRLPKANGPTVQMDRNAFGQMTRGKLRPEARIDLHGMTLAQAGPVLNRFISDSFLSGLRLVLVITGKGRDRDDGGPIPTPRGVLKRQVPIWLGQPPLSAMVLQTTDAHQRHGGGGALYVYLRRAK